MIYENGFARYLRQHGVRGYRIAELAGVTPGHISQLRLGYVTPSYDLLLRLIAASDNVLTAHDFGNGSNADA